MAKGGREEQRPWMPKFQETHIQQGLGQIADVAAYIDTPQQLYGPTIAAVSPSRQASYESLNQAAGAFGMPTATGSYLPEAQEYGGGIKGYSARPLVDDMMSDWRTENPGLAEYRATFGIDPVTGELGSNALENQPVALEMQQSGSRGK